MASGKSAHDSRHCFRRSISKPATQLIRYQNGSGSSSILIYRKGAESDRSSYEKVESSCFQREIRTHCSRSHSLLAKREVEVVDEVLLGIRGLLDLPVCDNDNKGAAILLSEASEAVDCQADACGGVSVYANQM